MMWEFQSFFITLLRFVFVLAFVSLIISSNQGEAADDIVAGRAEILTGTVTVERTGGQETLKPGDPVFVQDRLHTGAGSSAEIVFVDESRMKLASDTGLKIVGYHYDPALKIRHAAILFITGKARFFVQELKEFDDRRFRVQTETASVASRDTEFIVSYESELPRDEVCRGGLTNVLCIENSIIVSSLEFQGRPSVLAANMISQVCGPNLPTPPRFATAAELARIRAGLD
jgi:hypothetical protein